MDVLQKVMHEELLKMLSKVAAKIISDKLSSQGVTLKAHEMQKLIDYLRCQGSSETFHIKRWRRRNKKNISVEIEEEDIKEIETKYKEFIDRHLEGLIESLQEEISAEIIVTLKRTWSSESRRQNNERRSFEKRLIRNWGRGTDLLKMSLVIARDLGHTVNKILQNDQEFSSWNLLEVLLRLHARACQVTEEIVCLISSGFADGAMARWRTLHEISMVALLLHKYGEDLAKRYIDHQIVESFKALKEYQLCSDRLGYEPISTSEYNATQKKYDNILKKYGKSFSNQYGWAAQALSNQNPNVKDIEREAGIDHLRAHYRMASHNVHANAKGVYFKLGLLSEADILLAGPSDVGFADPGHSAAISLLQVSTALGLVKPNLDSLVILRILAKLEDEVGEAFCKADRQIKGNS